MCENYWKILHARNLLLVIFQKYCHLMDAGFQLTTGRWRWPESLFQAPTPLLFQNFWIRIRVRKFFKFENRTPIQTPGTIAATENYQWFHFTNDHADSCYCRYWSVSGSGRFFKNFWLWGPDPKEKRRILPESTPALRIRGHLCWAYEFFQPFSWIEVTSVLKICKPKPTSLFYTYLC